MQTASLRVYCVIALASRLVMLLLRVVRPILQLALFKNLTDWDSLSEAIYKLPLSRNMREVQDLHKIKWFCSLLLFLLFNHVSWKTQSLIRLHRCLNGPPILNLCRITRFLHDNVFVCQLPLTISSLLPEHAWFCSQGMPSHLLKCHPRF